jgi:hypothetical protein
MVIFNSKAKILIKIQNLEKKVLGNKCVFFFSKQMKNPIKSGKKGKTNIPK